MITRLPDLPVPTVGRKLIVSLSPVGTFVRMSNDTLLTVQAVAKRLDVSVKTVRRLYQGRYLPHVRIGGAVRFRRHDIDAFIAENVVEALHAGEVA